MHLLPFALVAMAALLAGCQPATTAPSWQGYIEAEPLYAASPVAGPLQQVMVEPGQQLGGGELLFALDPTPWQAAVAAASAQLAQAQAQRADLASGARREELAVFSARKQQATAALALAQSQYQRQQQLLVQQLTSREAFDQAQATLERERQALAEAEASLASARLAARTDAQQAAQAASDAAAAQLAHAQWQLAASRQYAHEAATVAEVLFRPGEVVASGQPVLLLHPHQRRRIRFYIAESERPHWRGGDALLIHCDGCQPFNATVSRIADSVSFSPPVIFSEQQRARLLYLVEAQVDPAIAPQLPAGQPVSVYRQQAAP